MDIPVAELVIATAEIARVLEGRGDLFPWPSGQRGRAPKRCIDVREQNTAEKATMRWNEIQWRALRAKVLVYATDQSQTAPLTQPGPWGAVQNGYCIGLAANWISLAYQGQDFPFTAMVCENPPWQGTMAQNYVMNDTSFDYVDEWKDAVEPFSCSASGLKAHRAHCPTASYICQVVFRAYGCYGITMRGPSTAHAVAMRNGRDGQLHLFDANYYHVAMKGTDRFQEFVSGWLQQSGYDKSYTDFTGVVGIKPPINHTHP
jgi:hypothetical protein